MTGPGGKPHTATDAATAAPSSGAATADLPGRRIHVGLERGTTLLDRYTVLDRLGAGGREDVAALAPSTVTLPALRKQHRRIPT
jgi:hypothetical protein